MLLDMLTRHGFEVNVKRASGARRLFVFLMESRAVYPSHFHAAQHESFSTC